MGKFSYVNYYIGTRDGQNAIFSFYNAHDAHGAHHTHNAHDTHNTIIQIKKI